MSKKQSKKTTATKKTASTKNTEPRSKATAARMTAQKQPPARRGAAPMAAAQAAPNHAASGGAEPRKLEPRMPAPGTLIQKRDRHGAVRCECTVEEGGIRYEFKTARLHLMKRLAGSAAWKRGRRDRPAATAAASAPAGDNPDEARAAA